MNSASTAAARAASGSIPRLLSARMRSIRDSPEPFSITSPSVSMPAAASVAAAARAPAVTMSSVASRHQAHPAQRGEAAGARSRCSTTCSCRAPRPRVDRVIGEQFFRPVGRRPSRTVPPRCPPTSLHNAATSAHTPKPAAAARRSRCAGRRRQTTAAQYQAATGFDHGLQVWYQVRRKGVRSGTRLSMTPGEQRFGGQGDQRVGRLAGGSGRQQGVVLQQQAVRTAVVGAHAAAIEGVGIVRRQAQRPGVERCRPPRARCRAHAATAQRSTFQAVVAQYRIGAADG